MKVLLLSHRFPFPPDRGDRLLAYRALEALAPRHEVHLLSFRERGDTESSIDAVRTLGVRVRTVERSGVRSLLRTAGAVLRGTPLQVAYFRSRRMAEAAASTAEGRFDAVLAQMIRMAPYGLVAPAHLRVVLLTDSLGLALARRAPHEPPWRRPIVRFEQGRVARFEVEMARRYDEAWMVSAEDKAAFPAGVRDRLRVVPNGFPPELLDVPDERPATGTILFVGHLSVPHNVDSANVLARAILPLVRDGRPGVRLRLVGADPGPAVRALHAPPVVDVVGFVPSLGEEFRRADVFVAPLRFGSGVQNKLIEALAAATPVVTTPLAARGLGLPDDGGGLVLTGTDPFSLARAVTSILDDPPAARDRARRARTWVSEHFRWENMAVALEELARRSSGGGHVSAEAGHGASTERSRPRGDGASIAS